MGTGSQQDVRKVSASLTKSKDIGLRSEESRSLEKESLSTLPRKIHAQLNHGKAKKNFNQPRNHRAPGEKKTTANTRIDGTPLKAQSCGKKRDSQGVVKPQGKRRVSDKSVETDPKSRGLLEKEVYALGGTVEDVTLVANLDSESELDDDGGQNKGLEETKFENGLKKGIGAIMKQIDEYGRPEPLEFEAEEDEDGAETGYGLSYAAPSAGITVGAKSASDISNLLIAARSDWFNIQLPPINSSISKSGILPSFIQKLYEHAKSLLDIENGAFRASQRSSSQHFYSTVIASGTLSDKISALTLAVQESPLHNVRALETLINLAKKRSRAQAVDVLRALKDLFSQGSLLPSDRKLHTFSANPSLLGAIANTNSWKPGDALPGSLQPEHLIVWAYESWLKEKYFEVLEALEVWCNDEIEFSKSRAINFVYELLKEKPEQEANLLRLLTNKLGDPSKKIASQTSYLLMQLMAVHPLMKMTIISSIESELLFRPGQSLHAKYYAAITLNQTALSSKEDEVASKLLSIYFSLFVGLLKPVSDQKYVTTDNLGPKTVKSVHRKSSEKHLSNDPENSQAGDLREKLTSAILTGINRAYPYTESSSRSLSAHLETLFKITHSSNFNTSIQAMMLIQQLCSSHQASSDRFYRTLYESLLDSRLITSSKQSLYLNLLYRALKDDTSVKRVKAFTKRILQMLALHQPSFICGCFFLIQELSQTFPGLSALIDQPEERDVDQEVYEDVRESDDEASLPGKRQTPASKGQAYDSRKRDPVHSNAENSSLWEIIPFLVHFHPSVSVGAEHIIRHAKLPGKPDLELHTLIHFLDRFAYRNAKAGTSNLRGSSIMQPLAGNDSAGLLVSSASYGQLPVNSEKFWARERTSVPAEDAFFHQYFDILGKTTRDRKTSKKTREIGDDSSENGESEIWKAMMASAPDLEVGDDSDQDLEMSDLESDLEENLEGVGEDVGTEASFSDEASLSSEGGDAGFDNSNSETVVSVRMGKTTKEGRRKLKDLPTFASAADYAKMVEDEEGEDGGGRT